MVFLNIWRKFIFMAIGLGLLAYLADTFLDWLYYDESFLTLLVTGVPSHELYSRLMNVILLAVFGLFAGWFYTRTCGKSHEQAQRFRSFVENANDIVYTLNPDGVFTYVSPNWQKYLGVPAQDVIGKPFAPFVHPEDVHLCNDYIRDITQGRTDKDSVEYRVLHQDGSWCWHISRGSLIDDEDSGNVSFIGIARDVTEHKQAVQELAESEQKYRELFKSAPVGIFTSNSKGQVIECNPAAARMFGLASPEKMISYYHNIASQIYVNGERRQEFLRLLQNNGSAENFEFEARRADGRTVWLSANARIASLKDDGSFEMEGFITDISERKLAEAERERMLSAIEQTGEIIMITDTAGRVEYVNPAFERITGYSRKEILGLKPNILKSGEQDEAFYDEMWQTLQGGLTWTGRLVNKRKDGSLFTEETTISPVRDKDGRIINYVGVKHDITEHLRMSEEKKKLEAQYQQAQKMESIGRLAGGVAHDLNNLLSPILGYGEMLQEDLDGDSPLKSPLEEIVSAGERARDLVRQLLAFSRKQVLEFKPVDLNGVLSKFEQLLRRTIREDIVIDLVLAPSIPQIIGDSGQLEQVIMNLAVNAQDAMPDGGKLTIETMTAELDADYAASKQSVEPGKYVMLGISDTGTGIKKGAIDHIFEPFFSTKAKEEGTGLGLSTVYGIVKQHGGNIWVYSEPGKGATFKAYFPVSLAEGKPLDMEDVEVTNLHGQETILLVEDNEQVRILILKILERLGYKILVAQDGASALTILENHDGPVELLLTDVIMPKMNGRELFDRVSSSDPGIKVLFMSGYTDNVIARHGIDDEGLNFIQKPFAVQALASKVRNVLDG